MLSNGASTAYLFGSFFTENVQISPKNVQIFYTKSGGHFTPILHLFYTCNSLILWPYLQ